MTMLGSPVIGLILSGGGARAAYQVGVLRAIAKSLPPKIPTPFKIICGTSAGGINAASLAAGAQDFRKSVCRLEYLWKNLQVEQVYRSDFATFARYFGHWIVSLVIGGMGKRNPRSLLDNTPLEAMLTKLVNFDGIQSAIDSGFLRALSITASGYNSGQSVSFFQAVEEMEGWNRAQRLGCRSRIEIKHLMATSAIPFVFPAVRINREFFGDGSVRQVAPISPALHLGSEKVLVIGASPPRELPGERLRAPNYPTLAQVAGHLMNSIFIDGLEVDLERITRVNRTLSFIPPEVKERKDVALREVEMLVIAPSKALEMIAARHAMHFPTTMKFMLGGLGALKRQGSVVASYLLFHKHYTRDLIELGYQDAMRRQDDIVEFLGYDSPAPKRSEG
ncbi:patatin-like phospholipase family protein [Parachitinimonas caeni]|uniref:Patatin-like phospholipase family protein n=1 Tax=Parachitinimonas caeni TaxID=3031301 RepID=A0ABT7DWC4_9NEIS|nr:patatin-like phospholipase family protein [Parachitinimonas caeni]MDK2123413.1 patatin-like phospholipase family protein [Parachitinimonas caeni]